MGSDQRGPRFSLIADRCSPVPAAIISGEKRRANGEQRLFLRRAAGRTRVSRGRVGIRSLSVVPIDRVLALRTLESNRDLLVDLVDVKVVTKSLETVCDHLHPQWAEGNAVEVRLP